MIETQPKIQLIWRSPLVPQLILSGDSWLIGLLFRSPCYRRQVHELVSREDISEFFHAFDE
jgi:hypothetical protein